MTGSRGPKSKAVGAVRRSPKAKTNLVAAKATAPELRGNWGPEALEWWQAWIDSAQASLLTATDWQTVKRGVVLVDLFFQNPSAQIAAEIRQIESKLGATISDRDRLGLKIEEPAAPEEVAPSRKAKPDPRRAAKP